MQILDITAKDESAVEITFTYTDKDGIAVTPDTVTWTLTDFDGKVINSRKDVSIAVPSTKNSFLLQGDDINTKDGLVRIVTCDAVYTSATYGAGIPLRDQGQFNISAFTEPK